MPRKALPPGSFTAMLAKAGLKASEYVDLLTELGATESREAILTRVARWNAGINRPSGEAIALISMVGRVRKAAAALDVLL